MASSILENLPSRGLCTAPNVRLQNKDENVSYFCTHNTTPPSNQIIAAETYSELMARFHKQICSKDDQKGKRGLISISGGAQDERKNKTQKKR